MRYGGGPWFIETSAAPSINVSSPSASIRTGYVLRDHQNSIGLDAIRPIPSRHPENVVGSSFHLDRLTCIDHLTPLYLLKSLHSVFDVR